jgi:hypothetical protein
MSAWSISKKRAAVAIVLVLMVIGAGAGYATAASRTPAQHNLVKSALAVVPKAKCPVPKSHIRRSGAAIPKCLSKKALAKRKALHHPSAHAKPTATPIPAPSSSPSQVPSAPASIEATPTTPAHTTAPTSPAPSAPTTAPAPPASTAPTSAPPSPTAAGPACVISASDGACYYTYAGVSGSGTDGGNQTNVIQNIWNPIGGITQTMTVYNPGNWSVTANMPAANKAVVSYPDVQQIYTTTSNEPNPLSGYSSITSSYTESSPANGDYEAAYDIWANSGSQEIMIWVENHGQTPAGSVVASATIDGVGYQVWSTGPAGSATTPISMVMNSTQASGSVNILDDLHWLQANGYMKADSGINQIDFGWEICSTAGVPETFTLNRYTLTATCTSGTSCTR